MCTWGSGAATLTAHPATAALVLTASTGTLSTAWAEAEVGCIDGYAYINPASGASTCVAAVGAVYEEVAGTTSSNWACSAAGAACC